MRCKIILLLIITFGNIIEATFLSIEEDAWKNILLNFVNIHEDHKILILHDQQTNLEVDSMLKLLPPAEIYTDFDVFSESFSSSEQSLNIIFLSNITEVLPIEKRIFQKNSKNIFVSLNVDMSLCRSEFSELVPDSFILDTKNSLLYSCYDEDENLLPTLVLPAESNEVKKFHRSFKNLKGKTLLIYHGNYLTLRCRKNTHPDVCIIEGQDYNILKALSQALNFTADIQRYNYHNYTNIWTEMLEEVNYGEADIIAGSFLVVAGRKAYFTSFTWGSPIFGTLFVDPIKELGFWIVLETFDLFSYMATIVIFLVIFAMMCLSSYICRWDYDVQQNLMALLKVLVEQGTSLNRVFQSPITKYLFCLWLILNIIISSSLKSILSSVLIKPRTFGFTKPEDLIDNRYIYMVSTWVVEFFKTSMGPLYSKLREVYYSDFLDHPNQCGDSYFFFQFKLALVHTEFSLVYLSKACEKFYPIDKLQNLRFIKDSNVFHAYPMKPSSPYRGVISKNIARLHASGLISHWYYNITLESLRVKDMGYTFLKPISMTHLFSFFMILLGGLSCATLIFIFEWIHGRISNGTLRRFDFLKHFRNKIQV